MIRSDFIIYIYNRFLLKKR